MANLSSTITITMEYRPCIVKGRKALFHRWSEIAQLRDAIVQGTASGQIKQTVGIIEYEDGVVADCYPYEIRFCDNKFKEYHFSD